MGEFINVLVSKGKSNLIPEKDNLYGQFVGEWDFEWVDNQGTTGERHVQGEWIFAWVLEGTAIQDVFICPSRKARIKDYQPDAAYATAVRMYNPNTEAWDILYTELGGATQLEGKREGNRIVQTEINEREFEIKSKNSKLSVIDKLYVNGGLLFKKAVCRDSRQGVGYKVTE